MSITAIQGLYHNGKIEPLEKIPYKVDKKVIIVFFDDMEDRIWNKAVMSDYVKCFLVKSSSNFKMMNGIYIIVM